MTLIAITKTEEVTRQKGNDCGMKYKNKEK